MSLDVLFTPAGLGEVQGRVVFVIDILRAGTTICAALHHGARAVIPVAGTEEALRLAATLGADDTLLAGERNCLRIEGFHLGNSPREMAPEVVRGRTIILTTTNGTGALLAVSGAAEVYLGGAVNFGLAAARARRAWLAAEPLLILCAGREQEFALDDGYTAGRLVRAAIGGGRGRKGLNDAAIAALDLARRYGERWGRPLAASRGGRNLTALGLRSDVEDAARVDAYPALPRFADRRITAAPASEPDPSSSKA